MKHGRRDQVPAAHEARSAGRSDRWLARSMARRIGPMPRPLCGDGRKATTERPKRALSGSLSRSAATDRRRWSAWSNDERAHDFFFGSDEFDYEFLLLVSRLHTGFEPFESLVEIGSHFARRRLNRG